MPNENHMTPEERSALAKLQRWVEHRNADEVPPLTDDEIKVVRFWIRVFQGLSALGYAGAVLKNAVLWLGVIIGAYWAVKNWVIEAAKGAVRTLGGH